MPGSPVQAASSLQQQQPAGTAQQVEAYQQQAATTLPDRQYVWNAAINNTPADVDGLLQHMSSHCATTTEASIPDAVLQTLQESVSQLSTRQLADVLWSLSNLPHCPVSESFTADILAAVHSKRQDFYAPDLCSLLCAAGALGLKPPHEWLSDMTAECEYQLCEFPADFGAFDLAKLASGLADLDVAISDKMRTALMKSVYTTVRTMEEKGAVDFALAKLDLGGKKSVHFDPRWTHEELNWLPRRERDKRRILKEGWYRTKWGGWTPE